MQTAIFVLALVSVLLNTVNVVLFFFTRTTSTTQITMPRIKKERDDDDDTIVSTDENWPSGRPRPVPKVFRSR